MKITALTPGDLPFRASGMASCAAARSAAVMMELPGVPGKFKVEFIGTGVATIPEETQKVFDLNDSQSSVEMNWYQNKFIGRHWLLGDFKVDLAEDIESTGVIEISEKTEFGPNTTNTNDFFFDFQFKRFPFLNMRNITPIRNTAAISAIPPNGSVFKLEPPADGVYEMRTGPGRITNKDSAPQKTIKFNQCDVLVFPERNVGLRLIDQKKLADQTYSVTVEIENITGTQATFAYFSVVHYAEVDIENDYGFVLLHPNSKKQVTYKVKSKTSNRTIDIPFFTALYKPQPLNGYKQLELEFTF